MAKIYDALKRAQDERTGGPAVRVLSPDVPARGLSVQHKLVAVYQTIESALPDKSSRVITLVGSHPGEGVSTLTRQLSMLAGRELAKKVALIDFEHGLGGHHEYFGVALGAGFDEMDEDSPKLDNVLAPVENGSIMLGCATTGNGPASAVIATPGFKAAVSEMRDRFDLILFDAPPVGVSSDALLLAGISDGVILVVEAEKTRWQVAQSVCEKIRMQGGNVLGAILNKRQLHIPEFIYRRL